MKKRKPLFISVVIPIYNEEVIVAELYNQLSQVFHAMGYEWEYVFIDDGSKDSTLPQLIAMNQRDRRVKVLSFSRNFGHQVAISAGLDHASGDAIIIMDGDLQDPPRILPEFVKKWREGYDVVYAVRRKRKEGVLKRAAYAAFYRILRRISYLDIPLDSGDFCLMDKSVAEVIRQLPERNRFVRGLRSWVGFRQTGVEYERDKRYGGEPKYKFTSLMRLALDGIFSFSFAPLRLAGYFGFVVSLFSFALAVFYLLQKLLIGIDTKGWASTIIIILFLGGVQMLTVGIIGEYIGRIYDEVKQRPSYVVKKRIGFDRGKKAAR